MQELKIEMIHDAVCSWCPIGYSNIKQAINNLSLKVDFRFLPFELNPHMPKEGEEIGDFFKHRHGWSTDKLLDYQTSLVKTAKEAGVIIDFSKRTHYYNTRNAHKLIHFAESFNLQTDVNESLIRAYFKQGLNINNIDVLLIIAQQVGLDGTSARAALLSEQLGRELEEKITRQKRLNIRSVPAFLINEDTLISGSNSVKSFEESLSVFAEKSPA